MKKLQIGFIILALVLAMALQGCGGPGGVNQPGTTPTPNPTPVPGPGPENIVHIDANISGPTNWTSDKLYVLDKGIFVNAALTIQPGTIIKFSIGAYIWVNSTGSISANGNSGSQIYFTSLRDDNIGGDTNGDGNDTQPAKGNWKEITLQAGGSIFNYCNFYYGGSGGYQDDALIESNGAVAATVTNCTFAHSLNAGLDLVSALATTVVNGNTFFDTTRPLWMAPDITLDDSNVFHHPDYPTIRNAYNGIWISGSISSNTGWGETEVPFVITNGLTVNSTYTLTLQPGVTIKTMTGSIHAGGKIVAAGNATNRITFTSYKDDTKGGDTNNNGSANAPAKGNWGKLYFSEDGSILSYCDIYYGGTGTLPICQVQLNVGMTIDNCKFAHGNSSALDIQGADPDSLTLTNNAFYDTTKPLLMNVDMSINNSNVFHNPDKVSQTNVKNGIWLQGGSFYTPRTWGVTEVPYVCPTLVLSANLSIATGAIVKFDDARLDIGNGATLNYAKGTNGAFTSIKDDARGGDTNGDGGATTPTDGDWVGVQDFNPGPGPFWRTDNYIYYDQIH